MILFNVCIQKSMLNLSMLSACIWYCVLHLWFYIAKEKSFPVICFSFHNNQKWFSIPQRKIQIACLHSWMQKFRISLVYNTTTHGRTSYFIAFVWNNSETSLTTLTAIIGKMQFQFLFVIWGAIDYFWLSWNENRKTYHWKDKELFFLLHININVKYNIKCMMAY